MQYYKCKILVPAAQKGPAVSAIDNLGFESKGVYPSDNGENVTFDTATILQYTMVLTFLQDRKVTILSTNCFSTQLP